MNNSPANLTDKNSSPVVGSPLNKRLTKRSTTFVMPLRRMQQKISSSVIKLIEINSPDGQKSSQSLNFNGDGVDIVTK